MNATGGGGAAAEKERWNNTRRLATTLFLTCNFPPLHKLPRVASGDLSATCLISLSDIFYRKLNQFTHKYCLRYEIFYSLLDTWKKCEILKRIDIKTKININNRM